MLKTMPQDVDPVSVSGPFNMDTPAMTTVSSMESVLKAQTCTKASIPRLSKPFFKDSLLQMTNPVNCSKSIIMTEMAPNAQTCFPISKTRVTDLQSNLFQAGFEDCASEVIRFLVEQEEMDGHNPLIQGLQSHLRKMSNTICGENIADLDRSQQHISPSSDVKSSVLDASLLSSHSFQTNSDAKLSYDILHCSSEHSLKRKRTLEHSTELSSPLIDTEILCSTAKRNCLERLQLPKSDVESVELVPSLSSDDKNVNGGLQNTHHISLNNQLPFGSSDFRFPQPLGQSSPLPSLPSSFLPTLFSSSSTTFSSPSPVSDFLLKPSENHLTNTTESTQISSTGNPSSVLELRAHFLPGIDTSSLASGNFADTLLAVESCQSHENPRVRELADKIINLIHHNDDEDDDDDDDYEDEDEEANVNDYHSENNSADVAEHEDSGVDLGEDVADWCNPVDMIEL